jgi:hypothetical protein
VKNRIVWCAVAPSRTGPVRIGGVPVAIHRAIPCKISGYCGRSDAHGKGRSNKEKEFLVGFHR